jgi:hypothetical protein
MPNHITNVLRITAYKHRGAPEGTVAKVLEALQSEELPVDFNRIIPMPADQQDNWYAWRVENWGTKWNSYSGIVGLIDAQLGYAHFETAWGPPMPVIDKLAAMFPQAGFRLMWCDEGDSTQHRMWWDDGKRDNE